MSMSVHTIARRAAWRAGVRVIAAATVVLATSMPAAAAVSPQGDVSAPWPVAWNAYRLDTGVYVMDALGDENPDNADLSSGACTPTGCTGGEPTVWYASDGTNAFFRVRLAVDPADASKGGLSGNAYLTQIAVGGTMSAVVGVDGKSASVDYVYTATAPGTTVTPIYEYPFTTTSAGMRVVPAGGGEYFLDYQVPIARITTASGGTITASTPIQLYYGSSAAANLATLNKDLMRGTTNTVLFGGLAVVSFAPAALSATSDAVYASGPSPARTGSATTYTVTLTATNTGGGAISGATAVATLPAGVTYVSGGVSMSGSTLTWAVGDLLPGATASMPVTLSLTPSTPGPSAPLMSALSVSGTDLATGATRTASAPALTVGPVVDGNSAPVANPDALTVAEDGAGSVDVAANDTDADGGALTTTIETQPAHGTASLVGGVLTYTPAADYNGPDTMTYTACDPANACDTTTVTITVTAVNDPPAAPPASSFSTAGDTAHTGTLPGSTDPDGDALTFASTTLPAHGTLTVDPAGTYTYTPEAGYSGPDSFGYEVCDPSGACASATVTVTVVADPPGNQPPPSPGPSSFSTLEDTAHSGTLPGSVDPDGDALTFAATTLPAHGSLTVDPDGAYTYTPAADYNGPDSFGYEVCDPSGACADAVVTVTVTAVNDPPATPPDSSFSTLEDSAHSGSLPGSVDPDGDLLTFGATTLPAHGTLTVDLDGAYTYTPAADYNGPDSFGYEVCDPAGACAAAVVTVTVTAVNDPPASPPDSSFSTLEDTAHSGTLPGSVDPDGDALTFGATTLPTHGTLTVDPGGAYTYTPAADYNGPDSFGYEVCDPSGACADAVVTVLVSAVNDPPASPPDSSFSTQEDTAHSGSLPGSVDPDGDLLTFAATTLPAHGTLTVDPDGSYTYTPAADYNGPDSFGYEVCDPSGACAAAVVTVTVTAVNDPPPAPADSSFSTPQDTAHIGALPGSVDPDGDAVTFEAIGPAGHGVVVVAGDGAYTYTPTAGYFGPDSFAYRVCDPSDACASATVSITVVEVPVANSAPVAADDAEVTDFATPVSLDPTANDNDSDGDTLSFTVPVQPAHGTVTVAAGQATYTPDAGYVGQDTFDYVVCDPWNACDTGTVTVTVSAPPPPANLPPVADAGDDVSVASGQPMSLDGTGSSDPDLDELTYSWVQTAGPVVVLVGAHTATPSFAGVTGPATLTFELTVSDGELSDTSMVTVEVLELAIDPPVTPKPPAPKPPAPKPPVTPPPPSTPGVRPREAVRPAPRPDLPMTGTPLDVLPAAAMVLLVTGAALVRRGRPARPTSAG